MNVAPPYTRKAMLVVLYKLRIGEAPTLRALQDCHAQLHQHDTLLVWDNSPEPSPREELDAITNAIPCAIRYRHTPENTPLSKVYNEAAAQLTDHDLLVLFDQDSVPSCDYFSELDAACTQHPDVQLFLPLIISGRAIVSPGDFRGFKGRHWTVPRYGLLPARGHVAITSGMAIRPDALRELGGFDEALPLYGIDTNLMLRFARRFAQCYVLHAGFTHSLSHDVAEPAAVKRRRFESFRAASRYNARLLPWPMRLLSEAFLMYRTLKFRVTGKGAGL